MRFTIAIGLLTTMIPAESSSAHNKEEQLSLMGSHDSSLPRKSSRNVHGAARGLGLPHQSRDRKQRQQRLLQRKASSLLRSNLVADQTNDIKECDPNSDVHAAVDIGILSCTATETCIEDESSTLGGVCVSISSSRLMQEDTADLPPYGVICDPLSEESQGFDCDCDAWDLTRSTGSISCVGSDSPLCVQPACNDTCLSIREFYEVDEEGIVLSGFDYDFYSPHQELAGYTYFYNQTCEFQLNGTVCGRCDLISVPADGEKEGYYCADFDCTNAGGTKGNSCYYTEGIDYAYVAPIIAYCEQGTHSVCNFCPGGELTKLDSIRPITITTERITDTQTSRTCRELYNLGSRGLIAEEECQASKPFVKAQCGCEGEDGVVAPAPIDGSDGGNNADNNDSNDVPAAGVVCNICGEGKVVTNAAATVTVPGRDELSCGDLQVIGDAGTITADQCGLIPQFVAEVCGCSDDSTSAGKETSDPATGGASGAPGQGPVFLASALVFCISTLLYSTLVQ